MPPEPLPWDRKELRKHDSGGGGSGGLGFAGPRWREAPFPHHHPYNHHQHHHNNNHHGGAPPRWLPDLRYRPPLGHGKQGGKHLYLDDFGHGFMTSRANEKMVEDESYRPSGSGRYGRSSREGKGSFCQKDWRGHSSDTFSLPNGPGRPNCTSDQRSVDNMPSHNPSIPSSDSINSRDQSQSKDQHGINGAVGSTGQKLERENSLNSIGWKPLKWTRSCSMSSRGSGFSHSSSSKSMAPEPDKMKVELMPKNVTCNQSPLADDAAAAAAACAIPVAPSEETNSRKKPRLGWGEGLAKYEKKKVEGADDSAFKNGVTVCGSNSEPGHGQSSNLTDKSTRNVGFSDCASPATPSSVACSSSPGVEEKLVKAGSVDHDCANLCSSPSILSQNHSAGSTFNLENLDLASFSRVNLSVNELLQYDDPGVVDSGLVRSTAMNKLLVLKNDVSKVLEATESEIDLLENELKSLISEPERSYPCIAATSSIPAVCDSKTCEDHSAASSITVRPAALELIPSGCVIVEDAVNAPNSDHVAPRDEDVDSPSSATSKFVQLPSLGKDVCPPGVLKDVEYFIDHDVKRSEDLKLECSMDDGLNEEKAIGMSSPGVQSRLIARSPTVTASDDNLQSGREEILYELILATNKDLARRSSEVINKLLPTSEHHIDISSVDSASCLDDSVKKRFLRRKRFLQLKERIITLKFKMFQYLWKEDTRLLSLKKLRAKSQKKFDLSLRTVNGGSLKHRSIRSRYASAAVSLSLEPATELINYASRLLSKPQAKHHKNVLKMPALILDEQERMASRFISSNGLVEDPCAFEKERSVFNPWTTEEKKIFLEKLALFGKDFRKIASFLGYKTTADCIEFYYKNHKSDSFEKTKQQRDFEKRVKSSSANTYLVASGKRWSREANAVSLDLLGAATAIAAKIDDGVKIQQNCTSNSFFGVSNSYRMPRGDDGMLERSNSMDLHNDERETVAADVLAGICGSLSSEAMSSCITSSVDPGDGYQEWKYQRVGCSIRRPLTPEVTQNVGDETCSDESCGEMDPMDWTDEEKFLFIQAVSSCGRDFAMISSCVRTRSRDQCKVFFSKARKCLGLDMICPGSGNPVIDDANGGGSDMEDACVVETAPIICSEKSGFKMDVDIQSPDDKLKHDPEQVGLTKPDLNNVEDDNVVRDKDSAHTMLVSDNLVPDDYQMKGKPKVDFDPNGIGNDACAELISVQLQDNLPRNSGLKAAQSVGEANNHNLSNGPGSEAGRADANAAYVDDPEPKLEGQGLLLHEGNLNVVEVVKSESSPSDISGMKCSLQDKQSEAQLAGNDSHSTVDTSSSGVQRLTDSEMDSAGDPCVIAPLENNFSVPLDAGSKVSATTEHGKCSDNDSPVDIGKISDEHRAKAFRTTEQHLAVHSAAEHLESSNILRGYPVPVSTIKEISGAVSSKTSIQFQSPRLSDGTNFSQCSARDGYLQRCDSPKPVCSGAELSLACHERLKDCSIPMSGSASDVVKPCRNGDVKLFGQILSKPSQKKPNPNAQGNEDNTSQHDGVGGESSKAKNSSNQAPDAHSPPAKYDHSNFVGSENLALRSFDFWDRNRMQNGFSSMPDSALLLGKYPSAFGNYAMSSSKMGSVPLQGVGKNGECSLNSVSVLPTRDIGDSNGLADIQVYRNHEMQPFTIDVRQRRGILFSEMQRSGFDVVSGMQQQSRGMVGINVVGRGVLVGGQCTSISDPVAAIKMHYAKAEQYSGQAGNVIRDDDSWRGK